MKSLRAVLLLVLLMGAISGHAGDASIPHNESDGRHDFDFLLGFWNISNRSRLQTGNDQWKEFLATTVDRAFLNHLGNMDEMSLTEGRVGISLRFFDPASKQWSIYWAASSTGILQMPPVVGHFEGGIGTFYSDDVDSNKKPVKVRYTWSNITHEAAHWDMAFSSDGGKTWEVKWTMEFSRTH